ncbi:MAG: large conductance mechanosensitive channel protein MscL [Clostridia bacterium]|nr:large conductance mechanosensitive channel protein MscL [Clostridia bacterium]
MKKFFREFKEFAVKGNMMAMAVGIIIGGAFTAIVTSLVNDILMPLITALTGKATIEEVSFTVGGTEIFYGKFIQAIIVFLITAFVVFLLVKGIAKMTEKKKKEEEAAPEEPAGPTSEELLTEIRDLLKEKK